MKLTNVLSQLLTAITNIFYEAHIQLIDRLVDSAIKNMNFCGQATLSVDHFAFGFGARVMDSLTVSTT